MNRPSSTPPSRWRRLRDRDHTRGSLLVSMGALALPLVASSVLGGLVFQLVDLSFLSRLGESAVTAVVVTNQSLRQILFMIVMGASFGAGGLVSRHVGAGQIVEAEHVAAQVMLLGALASALFAAVGVLFPAELLGFMEVSPAVLEVGVPYVRLAFLLNFGFVFVFLSTAILNGAGDATTPLVLSVFQTAVALAAEWVLVFGKLGAPALGVQGAALGIAVGHLVSGALLLRIFFRGAGRLHLRRRHFVPDAAVLRRIAALSWPPALQMISGFLVNVVFLRWMGQMGEAPQAAYSIGLRISMAGPMVALPLAGACATLVGQNLGAGRRERVWRALALGLLANVAVLWSAAVGMALFRTEIMAALATDPRVIEIGSEFLLFQAANFGAWGLYFVFFRSLQAAGAVRAPLLFTVVSALCITIPLGAWAAGAGGMGPRGLFAAQVAGTWLNTGLTGAFVLRGAWLSRDPGR